MIRIIDYIFQLKRMCVVEEHEIGEQVGLHTSELHCLESLRPGEYVSSGELSERMRLSPSRGSRIIENLIAKGMLHRERDSRDRRSTLIALTERGTGLLRDIERSKESCERRLTRAMNEEDVRLVKSGLSRLFQSIEDESWEKSLSNMP
jgi:DNA-binding MarR family transcriptional regulator